MKWILIVVWIKAHAVVTGNAAFHHEADCLEAARKVTIEFPEADYRACFVTNVEE